MKFESLDLHPKVMDGIRKVGFKRCTPVQEQTFIESLAGRDIVAQAQTGTGKTGAFLITIFEKMMSQPKQANPQPRVLIIVPTRELAQQVHDEAMVLGRYLPFKSVSIIGGVPYQKQLTQLKKGVDILVGTPGRLIDLVKNNYINLRLIETFVIDEADRLFDMGFLPDVQFIAKKLPAPKNRQTMMFSATMPFQVRQLAEQYMCNPALVEIEADQITVEAIEQVLYHVSNDEKLALLLCILRSDSCKRMIVFCNTKHMTERLQKRLLKKGFSAESLTGDLDQKKRTRVIKDAKAGKVDVLIATDVAARGLHVDGVSHVVNYDLANDPANYVHRIGRTARAGSSGTAISFCCEDYAENLFAIEKYIEKKIKVGYFDGEECHED